MVMKAEIDRLLRTADALEQMVLLLKRRSGENNETIRRLRLLQGEILATVQLLQGDFPDSG